MKIDKLIHKAIQITAIVCLLVGASIFPLGYSKEDGFIISGGTAHATTGGGPIVLDGMDPVCHASYGENTDQYIAKVVKSVYDQSSMPGNNGKIAILGISSLTSAGGCGGNWNTMLSSKFLTQFGTSASGLQPQVQFITTSTELNTFFSTGITSSSPRMLWIPDDWSRSSAISSIFTTNAEKIADYVNSGGGLFSSNNTYGWLTALLPSAVFNSGGCNGGPDATADGIADFGLSNSIVEACWHGYFTGNVGTLKVLVDYPYPSASSTRKAVSIGGGSVSLPSSFTLAVSPSSPNAGEDLTITATAQTISGVPQAGIVVTVTVSSGPDAGSVLTATTDASGIAVITVRTNTTGTAVYTATATVNGVAKTVSATVSWNPPTTTTVAPTTSTTSTTSTSTTVVQTTSTTSTVASTTSVLIPVTTAVEETTTTVAAVITTTTVHDHSTHSHGTGGNLPQTGGEFVYRVLLSFYVMGFGFLILVYRKRK